MSEDYSDRFKSLPPEASRVLGRLGARRQQPAEPAAPAREPDLVSGLPPEVRAELTLWIDAQRAPKPSLAEAAQHILYEWARARRDGR